MLHLGYRWNFPYRWGSLLISQTKAIFFPEWTGEKNVAPSIEDFHGVSFESQHGKEKINRLAQKLTNFNR